MRPVPRVRRGPRAPLGHKDRKATQERQALQDQAGPRDLKGQKGTRGQWGQQGRPAPVPAGSATPNPLQVAILHWYNAIQTSGLDFAVGGQPRGVAFDGANIWVASCTNNGTVWKLRASDGATLAIRRHRRRLPMGGSLRRGQHLGGESEQQHGVEAVGATRPRLVPR